MYHSGCSGSGGLNNNFLSTAAAVAAAAVAAVAAAVAAVAAVAVTAPAEAVVVNSGHAFPIY